MLFPYRLAFIIRTPLLMKFAWVFTLVHFFFSLSLWDGSSPQQNSELNTMTYFLNYILSLLCKIQKYLFFKAPLFYGFFPWNEVFWHVIQCSSVESYWTCFWEPAVFVFRVRASAEKISLPIFTLSQLNFRVLGRIFISSTCWYYEVAANAVELRSVSDSAVYLYRKKDFSSEKIF